MRAAFAWPSSARAHRTSASRADRGLAGSRRAGACPRPSSTSDPMRLEVGENRRESVSARPTADRWLVADKAGVAGGAPDRAAAIGADRGRDEARRDARRRAAARASGRELCVPWIARDAEQIIARIALEREFRRICLADDDHSRAPELCDRQFVLRRPKVLQRAASPCCRKAGHMEIVFDRDRNSVEPGVSLPARATRIALFRGGERAGAIKRDETVQTGIKRLDALKRALDEFTDEAWPFCSSAARPSSVSATFHLIGLAEAAVRSRPASGTRARALRARASAIK